MDTEKIEHLIKELIAAIGEDSEREGLQETPARVANSFDKLFGGYQKEAADVVKTFSGENYDEMIICNDIDFYSTCEHHLLPFFGKAHIGYIPNKKLIGVSKLPRIVEIYARRLQNQERMTMQICRAINDLLKPRGVGVVIKAQHLCMMSRGVEKQNTVMTTSSFTDVFRANEKTRSEFLRLIE